MRIKIGENWYDSTKEPIMIIFDEGEQDQIAYMGDLKKYCSYPNEGFTEQEIEKFMEYEEEENDK
ncbi:hypothetical protein JK635_02210 [Neobacillus sp. YIM B02564]|uniref:Phage protein n=1 Tax=Neobacillus paridis TaxID=2803862 RepID=A0ABS1TIB3_9BACI|nr:hypothetical protein [Neobacillus paridis]MBL4951053.1 hypothetical protein [Neobacillus paridis]